MSEQKKKHQKEEQAAETPDLIIPEDAPETDPPKEEPTGQTEQTELQCLQEEFDAQNDLLLRTKAEYDNYRKRSNKERDAIYPQAKADTVEKFLPIIDNFERAVQCDCADSEFKKGIEMIFNSFIQTMTELSVSAIGEEGEEFDPTRHNAVMHVEDEELGQNVIAQVLQKGYKIGDRVIRYAMVKVAN